MSVKRYDIRSHDSGFPPLVRARAYGAWVSFDDHDAEIAARDARIAALEQRLSDIVREVRQGCNEIEWFASRKKDLSTTVDNSRSETWADVLLADVASIRALVERTALSPPPSTEGESA